MVNIPSRNVPSQLTRTDMYLDQFYIVCICKLLFVYNVFENMFHIYWRS